MQEEKVLFDAPAASIIKIFKAALPPQYRMTKEAKDAFQRAASVFIFYLTHCANDICREKKRQTIKGEDIVAALKELEFDPFVETIENFMLKKEAEIESKKRPREESSKQQATSAAIISTQPLSSLLPSSSSSAGPTTRAGADDDEEDDTEEEDEGVGDDHFAGEVLVSEAEADAAVAVGDDDDDDDDDEDEGEDDSGAFGRPGGDDSADPEPSPKQRKME